MGSPRARHSHSSTSEPQSRNPSRCTARPGPNRVGRCGQSDAQGSDAASRLVPVEQHTAVGSVRAVMLVFQVAVEPAELLPFHNRQARVQRIQVRHLNVGRVYVLTAAPREGDTARVDVFAFRGCARCYPQDAAEAAVRELQPHSDVDERNAERFELSDHGALFRACVHAKECKRNAVKQPQCFLAHLHGVRYDASMHPFINALQVLHLLRGIPQLLQRWRSRRAERVVRQEVVIIEQPNFLYWSLRDQVKNVAARATSAQDAHHLVLQLACKRPQADPARCGIEVVEDAVFVFIIGAADQPCADTGLEDGRRASQYGCISGHLGVVVRVTVLVRLAGEAVPCGESMAEVGVRRRVRNPWQRRPIRVAREVAVPMDDVRFRLPRLIASQVEGRHQRAGAHAALGIDVRDLTHHQEASLDADEVPLRPQPGQVGITTEQFA